MLLAVSYQLSVTLSVESNGLTGSRSEPLADSGASQR